jgi:hypothetical protein
MIYLLLSCTIEAFAQTDPYDFPMKQRQDDLFDAFSRFYYMPPSHTAAWRQERRAYITSQLTQRVAAFARDNPKQQDRRR